MTDLEFVRQAVARHAGAILDANDAIWGYAELAFHETKSAALLEKLLEENGFTVQTGLAGIPTCFTGTYVKGSGNPVMGVLGEFDALSSLSQRAATPEKIPVQEGAPGHGCGHCALGTGALAAAFAIKDYLDASGEDGTVIYFGCPAEEGAGSKQFMARAGLFDDVDFVYTWHPSTINAVEAVQSNAIMGANFRFKGRTSHAAASPHLGRSALDAVELMSVGCNYLREHVIPEARIHYAYIDAGGTAPNVVQDRATVRYEVRSPFVSQLRPLFDRVVDVAKGAALMTGTEMSCELAMAFTEYVPNKALAKIADEALAEVGAPRWDEEDFALARAFLNSYDPETLAAIQADLKAAYGPRYEAVLERPLDTETHRFDPANIRLQAGSTDVGDVGAACPTLNILVATACLGNVGHSWQMVAQSCSPLAHKGLLTAAEVMALSAIRTMHRPDIIAEARAEVLARNGGRYTCPLPDEVAPPLDTY